MFELLHRIREVLESVIGPGNRLHTKGFRNFPQFPPGICRVGTLRYVYTSFKPLLLSNRGFCPARCCSDDTLEVIFSIVTPVVLTDLTWSSSAQRSKDLNSIPLRLLQLPSKFFQFIVHSFIHPCIHHPTVRYRIVSGAS
jgi:hypothetical protein